MKTNGQRDLIAQCVIVVVVCIAAWTMFVRPKSEQLRAIEAGIEQTRLNQAGPDNLTVEGLAEGANRIRRQIAAINRRNSAAADSSELYDTIMTLARRHGVNVQTLNPGGLQSDTKKESFQAQRVSISFDGGYEQSARFLADLNAVHGFIRTLSLTLTPRDDRADRSVGVRFESEFLTFELANELIRLGEAADADR